MKKVVEKKRGWSKIILIFSAVSIFFLLFIIPFFLAIFDGSRVGNVALIPLEGTITVNGGSSFAEATASSKDLVDLIAKAEQNKQIQAIILEINSPGGSAVASDEIATAIKKVNKPVLSVIREVGASGGYWIASVTEQIFANRMSITGSIGVISSYLEFSGLMEKYGVGYEELTAGERKDLGTPFKKLTPEGRNLLQAKLDLIHDFFIEEVALNRGLTIEQVQKIATGEFYLGVEALKLGLIDQIGDLDTAKKYLQDNYDLEPIDLVVYRSEAGFFDLLANLLNDFSFSLGEGLGSQFVEENQALIQLK